MKRWKRALPGAALLLWVASGALAQAPTNPSVGKWKLNVPKSAFSPAPLYKSEGRVYEDWGDGLLHARFEGVDTQDKPTFREYVARPDGRDYPWVRRGAQTAWTIALKKVDARTFDFVAKEDGKVVQTGRHSVSADGKVTTVTYKFEQPNAQGQVMSGTMVFDKQ
jgi:hypothetical protein